MKNLSQRRVVISKKQVPKEQVFLPNYMLLSDKIFHITQILFIILFIIHLLLHFEQWFTEIYQWMIIYNSPSELFHFEHSDVIIVRGRWWRTW